MCSGNAIETRQNKIIAAVVLLTFCFTAMRHILVKAEADGNGEYSDAAIAAAHEKAEMIYEKWLSGPQTKESFAAYAEKYSEDGGSNTSGGLYGDIHGGQMVTGMSGVQNREVLHPWLNSESLSSLQE